METFNWSDYVQTFALGAFPWVSQLKKLDIHFKSEGLDAHGIFNFFASIFSMSIFIYMSQSLPYEIIDFPKWWVFILAAFFICIVYIGIFIYFKKEVNKKDGLKWPIFVNFICYIFLFCTLTSGFGLLKVHYGYYYFKGQVMTEDAAPIASAFLEIRDSTEVISEFYSDKNGVFNILIEKEDFEKCRIFTVVIGGYKEKKGYISKAAFSDQIQRIVLHQDE